MTTKSAKKSHDDSYISASGWVVLHAILFSFTGVLIKKISTDITLFEEIFYRALFSMLSLIIITKPKLSDLFPKDAIGILFIRGFFGFLGVAGMFYAMQKLPLAIAMTLTLTTPLFVMIFGRIFMDEIIKFKAILSSGFALAGIYLVLNINYNLYNINTSYILHIGFGLMGSMCTAIAFLSMRAALQKTTTSIVVFWFAFGNLVGGGLFSIGSFSTPNTTDLTFILGICIVGLLSDLTKTTSYKYAATWFVSLLSLLSVIFSAIWGRLIFNDIITFTQKGGIILFIIGVGLTIYINSNQPPAEREALGSPPELAKILEGPDGTT